MIAERASTGVRSSNPALQATFLDGTKLVTVHEPIV